MTITHILMPTGGVAGLTDLPYRVVALQVQRFRKPVELLFEVTARCSRHRYRAEADEHLAGFGDGFQ